MSRPRRVRATYSPVFVIGWIKSCFPLYSTLKQAQQQNPLLAQQQALAQSVYTKYGPQSNGGYPSPLKTPGAPIKTTDSDKGPEGCNLFVFHIPNDMTNLDLYQARTKSFPCPSFSLSFPFLVGDELSILFRF